MAPQQIENPGDPWEYVDDLRTKKSAFFVTETDNPGPPVVNTDGRTKRKGGVDIRIPGPIRCLVWLAVFAAGAATGAVIVARDGPDHTEAARDEPAAELTLGPVEPAEPEPPTPAPPPARPVLSAACEKALDAIEKHLGAMVAISSAHDKQLDILSDARKAIFMKDWRELNELSHRQRELDRSLATDKASVLPKSDELRRDINECRSQQN